MNTAKQQVKGNGFAMMFMVIIVSAVSLSASLLLTDRALTANTFSKLNERHLAARYAAEACAERALLAVRENNNYTGSNNFTVREIECTMTVTNEGSDERRVEATATSDQATANVVITTTALTPQLEVKWIDSANF